MADSQYKTYVVHLNDEAEKNTEKSVRKLLTKMSGDENCDIQHIKMERSFDSEKKEMVNTRRWLVVMKIDAYEAMKDQAGKEKGVNVEPFRPQSRYVEHQNGFFPKGMDRGKTYALFITSDDVNKTAKGLDDLLQKFEEINFIRPGYKLLYPESFGDERKYFVLDFAKNDAGKNSCNFIVTMKALLNDCLIDDRRLQVNWCVRSTLLRLRGEKVFKPKKSIPVEKKGVKSERKLQAQSYMKKKSPKMQKTPAAGK